MSDQHKILEEETLLTRPMMGRNGHHIIVYDDNTVACLLCNEKHTIPELVRRSSGFVEVVYTLFLVGEVISEPCAKTMEQDDVSVNPMNPYDNRDNLRVPTNNVYWSDNKTTSGASDNQNTYYSSSWSVEADFADKDIKQLRESVVEPES